MKYYISDLHIAHKNIIAFDKRPFWNLDDMHRELIERWNGVVKPKDEVYVLGDFAFNKKKGLEIIKQLNGTKYLIMGNHDDLSEPLKSEFYWIKEYAEVYDTGRLSVLCHYPIAHWNKQDCGAIHLYGHIHYRLSRDYQPYLEYKEMLKVMGRDVHSYNVGCMMPYMDYTPRTLDYIIEHGEGY